MHRSTGNNKVLAQTPQLDFRNILQNGSSTYWIVLDDPNNHVCGVEGFISCETVFDETSIIFYGWLMCRTDIVGFTMHVSSHDLGLKNVPVGLVDVEGNGFMSVYLRTPLFPKEVFDNGDELFGDLSLHRKDKLDTHTDGP